MSGQGKAAIPIAPEIPPVLEPVRLQTLTHGDGVFEAELSDIDLRESWARGVSVRNTAGRAVDLSGSDLEELRMLDAELRASNLANVTAPRSSLVRVRVVDSRLTGVNLFEAFVRDVTLAGCRIDLASFSWAGCSR